MTLSQYIDAFPSGDVKKEFEKFLIDTDMGKMIRSTKQYEYQIEGQRDLRRLPYIFGHALIKFLGFTEADIIANRIPTLKTQNDVFTQTPS